MLYCLRNVYNKPKTSVNMETTTKTSRNQDVITLYPWNLVILMCRDANQLIHATTPTKASNQCVSNHNLHVVKQTTCKTTSTHHVLQPPILAIPEHNSHVIIVENQTIMHVIAILVNVICKQTTQSSHHHLHLLQKTEDGADFNCKCQWCTCIIVVRCQVHH